MAGVVWAGAVSHTGAMMREPKGDPSDLAAAERVFSGFADLAKAIKNARLDLLVVIATDHFLSFDYDALPIFAMGVADRYEGWGEFGVPKCDFAGDMISSAKIHAELVEGGFDVVSMRDMKLDHSFSCPLQLIMREFQVPIVPFYVNCTIPPLPGLARCMHLGRALRDVAARSLSEKRIGVLGTGGLSHWVGMPQTGTINEGWDRAFLDQFTKGSFETLCELDSDKIIEEAGNGAAEIRNWLFAAGAFGASGARQVVYEPVKAWATGIGVVEMVR